MPTASLFNGEFDVNASLFSFCTDDGYRGISVQQWVSSAGAQLTTLKCALVFRYTDGYRLSLFSNEFPALALN
jgi:hypothetical protein